MLINIIQLNYFKNTKINKIIYLWIIFTHKIIYKEYLFRYILLIDYVFFIIFKIVINLYSVSIIQINNYFNIKLMIKIYVQYLQIIRYAHKFNYIKYKNMNKSKKKYKFMKIYLYY